MVEALQNWVVVGALVSLCACSVPPPGGSGGSGGSGVGDAAAPVQCTCDDIRGMPVQGTTAHQPLACGCKADGGSSCPRTIAEVNTLVLCLAGFTVLRSSGCGKVGLDVLSNFAASQYFFDERSQQLIGRLQASDTPSGPCRTFSTLYGEGLFEPGAANAKPEDICDSIERCVICNPNGLTSPSCFAP